MNRLSLLAAICTMEAALLAAAHAADPRYPDWPCAQAKVPELSVGAMWDGPSIADVGTSWQDDSNVKDLVARLAARRTPLDAAEKAIVDYMAGAAGAKPDKAKKLFAGLFDTMSQQRSEVINGIERMSRNEKELADKIRIDVAALRALQDKPEQDQNQAKITELANQVEWSTRIFEDRRKTIRSVCEVPTIIEQRVFALSRAIRQAMQ